MSSSPLSGYLGRRRGVAVEGGTTALAPDMARAAACCLGLGAGTCWGGRGACAGAAGPSAGTPSPTRCGPRRRGTPPRCRSCRRLPTAREAQWGDTHTYSTGWPRAAALTILALLDAAALVPDIGVDGVTPRAPLVPVGISAVILFQPVAGGWQEPAGSRVGRRAAGSPSPQGGRSHNAVPPLVSAIAPTLSPLPPRCPQPIPRCPMLPRATGGCCGAAGDTGAPVVMGCRGLPVLAAQTLLCRGPRAAVAGAVSHNAVPQVVWAEPGTASEPQG